MKIAIVIERLDDWRGGRERSTIQIARELSRRGQDVTIICQEASAEVQGVAVRAIGRRGASKVARLENFVTDVGREIGDCANHQFDIVHAMMPMPGANVYQLRSGTVPGAGDAGLWRRGPIGRRLSRIGRQFNRVRRRAAALERQVVGDSRVLCLPVSQMVAGELSRYYGRTAGVRVIYNAVDVPNVPDAERLAWRRAQRIKLGIGEGQTLFVTAARNFELKGVGELIAAFAAWYRQAASAKSGRLMVIGADRPGRYIGLARKLGVGQAIGFIEAVGADKMFQWFCAADVCVLLSWYDPCSRVVLEATRWGVPSITTASNGASEVLAEGVGEITAVTSEASVSLPGIPRAGVPARPTAGIVVPSPSDREAIVQAMERLSQPAFRSACRQRCLEISPRLSMERHVDELLAAYEELRR